MPPKAAAGAGPTQTARGKGGDSIKPLRRSNSSESRTAFELTWSTISSWPESADSSIESAMNARADASNGPLTSITSIPPPSS